MIRGGTIAELKQDISAYVRSAVPEALVQDAFAGQQYFGDLKKPLVTVSVQKIQVSSGGFQDYIGMYAGSAGRADSYGRLCAVELSLQILLPRRATELQGNALFSSISSALLFQEKHSIEEISCQEVCFEERAQCLSMQMAVKLQAVLAGEEPVSEIYDIQVIPKRKEGTA